MAPAAKDSPKVTTELPPPEPTPKERAVKFVEDYFTDKTVALIVVSRGDNSMKAQTLDYEKKLINVIDDPAAANWREIMANANKPVTHTIPDATPEDQKGAILKTGDFSKMKPVDASA